MDVLEIGVRLLILVGVYAVVGYFLPRPLTRTMILPEYERAIIFRLGKYHATFGPGPLLILPWEYIHDVVDMRMESTHIDRMNVMSADQVEFQLEGVEALHQVDPARVKDWAVDTDADAQRLIREVGPQALARAWIAAHEFADVLAATEEGRLTIPVRSLNEEAEPTGRRFRSVMIRNINVPEALADELRKAAEDKVGAVGIGYTRDAFRVAREQGVDRQILEWRDLDVQERLAEQAVQPIVIRGGSAGPAEALMAALLRRLLPGGEEK